jgi:hypothetical protein
MAWSIRYFLVIQAQGVKIGLSSPLEVCIKPMARDSSRINFEVPVGGLAGTIGRWPPPLPHFSYNLEHRCIEFTFNGC